MFHVLSQTSARVPRFYRVYLQFRRNRAHRFVTDTHAPLPHPLFVNKLTFAYDCLFPLCTMLSYDSLAAPELVMRLAASHLSFQRKMRRITSLNCFSRSCFSVAIRFSVRPLEINMGFRLFRFRFRRFYLCKFFFRQIPDIAVQARGLPSNIFPVSQRIFDQRRRTRQTEFF